MAYNMRHNGYRARGAPRQEVDMGVLKVATVGNSVGVILPKEILERLRVKRGDTPLRNRNQKRYRTNGL